jgi:threonine dehydrogenase-like Zn-dependent dehydrogenase
VGCQVQLIDLNMRRATIAQAMGAAFATPAEASNDQDLVLHTSGTAEGLTLALRIAGFEATIVELSWFGDQAVTLPLGEAFHAQRLSIKSSQVGRVATTRRSRWTSRRRLELALSLLTDPALDVLINSEDEFDALPQTFTSLGGPSSDVIMHRVRYRRDN